ncbi:MAG: hypothetical protein H7287_05930 [Thermoleophilia bacterium]|nr:hypothetical protein [Thermoleophilia bacterium]
MQVDAFTPAEQSRYDASVVAEGSLVKGALDQIGVPASALQGMKALPDTLGDDVVRSKGYDPTRQISIPIGKRVALGSAADQQWTIVGVDKSQVVELAQRSAAGDIVRSAVKWGNLVDHNVSLLDNFKGSDLNTMRLATDATEGVAALGQRAPITLVPAKGTPQPRDIVGTVDGSRGVNTPTWGDVLASTGLAKRTPVPAAPGYDGAVNLRALVGDNRNVFSSIGLDTGHRPVLIGTDSQPGPGAEVLKDLDATQKWYHDVARVNVWPTGTKLYADTDQSAWLGNASAGMFADVDGRNVISLNEGPRDESVRGAMLANQSGAGGHMTRWVSNLIQNGRLAVETHEAGHVANRHAWGLDHAQGATTPAAAMEAGIVDEAVADLFGASRAGTKTVAHIRDLKRLQNGFGTLDTLRAVIARTGGEPHTGTQLLTRPMMQVAERVGYPMMAEITGAAVTQLGGQLAGKLSSVDIPSTASALRNAAAWRLGDDSPTVKAMEAEWAKLGVPITPLTNAPREQA